MSNIAYSAVVLDEKSHQKLIEKFKNIIPENWQILADHQTINMGEIDNEYEKYLGFSVKLEVVDFAIDDKVIAIGTSGFFSKNKKAHITIAINKKDGGKPVMSNYLTNWRPLKKPLFLIGKVVEVKYK